MRQAREDRDERAGGATMLQPLMLRLTHKAAAFAAARPTLLFRVKPLPRRRTAGGGGHWNPGPVDSEIGQDPIFGVNCGRIH